MPEEAAHGGDPIAAAVSDVAAEARAHARDLAREVWERLTLAVPGAGGWDEDIVATGAADAEANLRALADVLEAGGDARAAVAPGISLLHARQLARTGTPLGSLLSVFQVGHEVWRGFYVDVLQRHARTTDELTRAAHVVSAATFAYLSAVTAQVTEVFEVERDETLRSGEHGRRETVRALLAGEPVDPDAAAVRLGLDLRAHHTALVAWAPGDGAAEDAAAGLEALVRRLAAGVGVARPLVVSAGGASVEAWLTRTPTAGEPPLDERLRAAETGLMRVVCGSEAPGPEGFRASHREAVAARHTLATVGAPGGLTVYRDVELLSLLLVDRERCRTWVHRELGDLARQDVVAERLRGTLEVLLAAESNVTRAAERLGVHKNTVVYRVRQAEQARGLPLGDRRLELEAALRLVHALPDLLA